MTRESSLPRNAPDEPVTETEVVQRPTPSYLMTLAIGLLRQGFAPIPMLVDGEGSKRPLVKWKEFQKRLPDESLVRTWPWDEGNGLAFILGGKRAVLDIDDPKLGDWVLADIARRGWKARLHRTRRGLHVFLKANLERYGKVIIAGRPVGDLLAGTHLVTYASPYHEPLTTHPAWAPVGMPVEGDVTEFVLQWLRNYSPEITIRSDTTPGGVPTGRIDIGRILSGVPVGLRNDSIFRMACKLRRADVPRELAEALILTAAANAEDDGAEPFTQEEALRCLASAYDRYPAGLVAYTDYQPSGFPARPGDDAYHGLAGDIVHTIEPYTEADPVALLVSLLTAFGARIGDGPHVMVEADRHPPRLFTALVGETSKARKGTSWGYVSRIGLELDDHLALQLEVASGLSSGEGVIWAVRDPVTERRPVREKGRVVDYQDVEVDAGVADKRLFVFEPEFARALKVTSRDGNILSPILRAAWDSGDLRVMNRNSPYKAKRAHVSILAHVTADEVRQYLHRSELGSGFANRFLWVATRRSKVLPEGAQIPDGLMSPLLHKLEEACLQARGTDAVERDAEAKNLWREVYPDLSEGRPGLSGRIASRAEAQVTRLSLIYALLDGASSIGERHLRAALAVWRYCEESARWLLGELTGSAIADRILRHLRVQGPTTKDGISTGLFKGNRAAAEIDAALTLLQTSGLAEREVLQTTGRPVTIWKAR